MSCVNLRFTLGLRYITWVTAMHYGANLCLVLVDYSLPSANAPWPREVGGIG